MTNFLYSDSNKRYHTIDYYYKHKYGQKVAKISLDGGFTCPNKDGSKGTGGCIYCSKLGSGDYAGDKNKDLITQFNDQKTIMNKKWPNTLYVAYFQANSNTYAEVETLKEKFEPIIKLDKVVGLNIATRCDAITDECLNYLTDLNTRTNLTVELGLQTIHDKTSKLINRCHDLKCFEQMITKLRKRKINIVVHIINGLPYETKNMMIDTVKYLNKLDIQGIKIHMLYVLKNTALEKLYLKEKFHVLTKEEYIDIVVTQLEYLRPEIIINRLTGDPVKNDLIVPNWSLKKVCVLNDIDKEFKKRRSYQGFNLTINNRLIEQIDYYLKANSLVINLTNIKIPKGKLVDFSNKYESKISMIILNNTDSKLINKSLKLIHNKGIIIIIGNNNSNKIKNTKYQVYNCIDGSITIIKK